MWWTQIRDLIRVSLADARRAERLHGEGWFREELRRDPESLLDAFELARWPGVSVQRRIDVRTSADYESYPRRAA